MSEAGCFSKEDMETYIKMSQFRNRIVHLYNHIDAETLYEILTNELGDIKAFYTALLTFIDKHRRP